VSEWFKEHAWKACVGETQPWVRIPPSPPSSFSLVNRYYLRSATAVLLFSSIYLEESVASVYFRIKDGGTWRYRAIGRGRPPKGAKFHVRYTDARKKQTWSNPYDTVEEAQGAAKNIDAIIVAQARGLSVEEASKATNVNRKTVKTAVEEFLNFNRGLRPRSVQAYTTGVTEFLKYLPSSVRFIDEAATTKVLDGYKAVLEKQDYAPKTIHNRLLIVCFLLKHFAKETGVTYPTKLVKMPRLQRVTAKPYSSEELKRIFAAMDPEEYIRYLFFVHSGCREQEVQYAEWSDIDFEEGTYTLRPKNDVGFVPKSFEERAVPLTTELLDILRARKKSATTRWIFTNENGDPEGHFLRKFKGIAKRAGLNCGQCETEISDGKYHKKERIKVSCADRPVCEKHYLHRLRKTAATRWLRSGINLLDIQNWLGHKSLETTQIYLGYSKTSSNRAKVDVAGKF
jgi:integrase